MTTKRSKTTPKRSTRKRTSSTELTCQPAEQLEASPSTTVSPQRNAPVVFKICAPEATRVTVAGTFNEWNAEATPLYRQPDGTWQLELYLPPGVYEYRFVIDGCWCDDPNATEFVPNPFGSLNAILRVT